MRWTWMIDEDTTGRDTTGKDATGAHLRILAEQAEDRLERARAAEDMAKRNARVRSATAPVPREQATRE